MPPQAPGAYKSQVNTNPSTFFLIAVMRWQCSNGNFWRDWWLPFFYLHIHHSLGAFPKKTADRTKKGQIPGPFVRVSCPNTDSLKKASWLGCRECNLNIWSMKKFTHTYIYICTAYLHIYIYTHINIYTNTGFRWFYFSLDPATWLQDPISNIDLISIHISYIDNICFDI